jgi:hypothetical protein
MAETRRAARRSDAEHNRARILQVAREALATSSDVALNSIANKAGVGLWGFSTVSPRSELGSYAARSYSLMSPPRTGLRWIRSWVRSTTGRSERGGRNCRARWSLFW